MIVDFKFSIDETVFYVRKNGLAQGCSIEQGKIRGFQIRKTRQGDVIGVDFKENNNIPIEFVSYEKDKIQEIVNKYNSKSIKDRIDD